MTTEATEDFVCGFVAVIGRPNVGKSTLVNALVGTKVSIVSPKPQTTRNRIHAILNAPQSQLILVDTPGFCADSGPLTRALRQAAGSAAADADLSLVIAEVRGDTPEISEADQEVLKAARRNGGQIVLALNKIDLLERKELLLPWMAAYVQQYELAAVIPISARTGDGLEELQAELISRLPASPALFPTDMHTDVAERFICAELVREQLLFQIRDEVPHGAAVTIESFTDGRDEVRGDKQRPICHLEGRIYVERDSQKAIVIGKGGHQIKAIGQAARQRIEQLLDCQVYLKLTVHVDRSWTTNDRALRRYGLTPEAR